MEIRRTQAYDKWFSALHDQTARARIATRIRRLQNGNPGDSKSVGAGVIELRIDYGPGYRVYYIKRGNVLILLLCGGDKSSQSDDIKKAKALAQSEKEM